MSSASFSGTGRALLEGTKQAGSSVIVTIASGATVCSLRADQRETWGCTTSILPSGAGLVLTATETTAAGTAPAIGTATIDILRPPVLDGDGAYLTTGLITGTGFAGSVVAVSIGRTNDQAPTIDPNCRTVLVSENGYWSCRIAQPSGGPYVIRAQQSNSSIGGGHSSAYSNGQNVTVDRDAPASAVISSPRAGSRIIEQPSLVSGSGESGAAVDVYVDDVPTCSTTVSNGAWSCRMPELSRASHELRTIQRDSAGNFSPPSTPIQVFYGPRSTASTSPTPPAPQPAAPVIPNSPRTPGTPGTPSAPGTPTPQPDPSSAAPVPPNEHPPYSGPDGSGPPLAEALTNWGTPTGFGGTLAGFGADDDVRGGWYIAPLLGLIFLALVALPLSLLASALRGRITIPHAQFTGRNQGPRTLSDADVPKPVNAWLAGAVPVAAAAGLVVLAGGVGGEVRFLRLFLAVGLGLVILNIVGAAVATRLGAHWNRIGSRLRFLPIMLFAAALAALVSRFAEIEPPLTVGVLVGAVFAAATPVKQRAMVNLVQVGVVVALGVAGWLAHAVLGPVQGFWASVASETLATLCLAGLGSAVVLVLPLAALPGRVILEWSPVAWIGTVLAVSSIVAAVVFGNALATVTLVPWIMAATGFAALSLAVWTFVRFVEPRIA